MKKQIDILDKLNINIEVIDFTCIAFRAAPHIIRAFIPRYTIGTYALLHEDKPVYVGRSDHCLRKRLSKHELLSHATYVIWEPRATPLAAYYLEAAWYHSFFNEQRSINKIHPALPRGIKCLRCPFCSYNDIEALRIALTF